MKLLMTADTLGGVWTYCMELCAALEPAAVHIMLATMGRTLSPRQRRQVQRLPHVRVYESDFRLCWMPESQGDVARAGNWLLDLERRLKPDLIHLNDLGHGGLAWRAPVILVGHSCVYSWWRAVKKTLPPATWTPYRATVSASVRRADLLVAPSQAMLNALLHYYGPARAATVIANGQSFPPLAHGGAPPAQKPAASQYRYANSPADIIFASGRLWDPAKNIGALAAAAEHLPWPVYVAGDRLDPDGGGQTPHSLRCLGFLNQPALATWLRSAAVYVAPAHYEPFGLGILEAARAGCALVLGDIASLREIWGDAAVYVAPDDSEALRHALTALMNDSPRRPRLAQRAWLRAQTYTASKMAQQYLDCYRRMIYRGVSRRASLQNTTKHRVGDSV